MRPTRSHVHMLNVAAARLASDYANPQLVADLRKAAEEAATAIAEGRGHTEDDDRRIERQRTLFNMLPDCRAADALRQAMLQRVYDLMWDGSCIAADAIAEFLPSSEVKSVFNAWEADQEIGAAKSKWHGGAA